MLAIRVITYEIDDEGRPQAEKTSYRLATTILGPSRAPADELAGLYPERWAIVTLLDELNTHERGPKVVLGSKMRKFGVKRTVHRDWPRPTERSREGVRVLAAPWLNGTMAKPQAKRSSASIRPAPRMSMGGPTGPVDGPPSHGRPDGPFAAPERHRLPATPGAGRRSLI